MSVLLYFTYHWQYLNSYEKVYIQNATENLNNSITSSSGQDTVPDEKGIKKKKVRCGVKHQKRKDKLVTRF